MDDTNRPQLSPAAQAVLDAADDAFSEQVNLLEESPISTRAMSFIAAAALRAAADQVEHHWDGMECVDHLQAIAAELEGHHD